MLRDGKDLIDHDVDGKFLMLCTVRTNFSVFLRVRVITATFKKKLILSILPFLFLVYDLVGTEGNLIGALNVTVEAITALRSLYQ